MRRIANIFSEMLSILLYPLWMPTYGIIFLCAAMAHTSLLPLTPIYWLFAVGGTLFFTGIVPLLIILVLRFLGMVKDMMIEDSRQRTVPYMLCSLCMICWCLYLQRVMHMPLGVLTSAWASVFILLIMTIINLRWKISIHMATYGCLMTAITAYMLENGIGSLSFCCGMVLLAWLLMCARVQLNAHTPAQVSVGLLLGILVPMIPHIFIYRLLYA